MLMSCWWSPWWLSLVQINPLWIGQFLKTKTTSKQKWIVNPWISMRFLLFCTPQPLKQVWIMKKWPVYESGNDPRNWLHNLSGWKRNWKKFRPVCWYVQISVYVVLNIITGLASEETDIQPCVENETLNFGLWTELKNYCIVGRCKWKLSTVANVLYQSNRHSRWSSATGRVRKFPHWILKT